jgi:Nitroreductase family
VSLAVAGAGLGVAGVRRMGSMADYTAAVAAARAELSPRPELADLVRYATLAPNGHNTQPWRFRIDEGRIAILPDFSRRTPVVDPDDHHIFVSLGCAAENLALAAGARGRGGEITFEPANDGGVIFTLGNGPPTQAALFDAITKRQSTRADYDGRTVSGTDLQTLVKASAIPGVEVVLITSRAQMDRVRDLVLAGNSSQMGDAAFVRELKSWIRFSPHDAMTTGDGLFSATSGLPAVPHWLGSPLFDWNFRAAAENAKYTRHIGSSAGIAVFIGAKADREHWVLAGRACQRFALQATALGLKHAFVNQAVEVASLRPELANLIGMPGRRPDIVMRFGYGPTLPYSARRPVDAVVEG